MPTKLSKEHVKIAFEAINGFVKEINEVFGNEQHSLRLYVHLLEKIDLSHERPVQKHIEAFKIFCETNKECLFKKDKSLISFPNILFSSKVFINMEDIFNKADDDTLSVIWKHLLTIFAIVSPQSGAKKILESESTEDEFINKILKKVENTTANTDISNPMEAISSIMGSGIFSDLVSDLGSGINDGSLQMEKLLENIQEMSNSSGGPDLKELMKTVMSLQNHLRMELRPI